MYNLFTKRGLIYVFSILFLTVSLSGCDIFKSDGDEEEENQQQEEEEPIDEPSDEPSEMVWYRGNLHAHSYWTDGDGYPDMILNWYKEEGYDFAVISGHNDIHVGESSIDIQDLIAAEEEKDEWERPADPEFSLQRYRDAFGDDWVEFNEADSTVGLKNFEEYSSQLSSNDFLVVRSQEIDYRDTWEEAGEDARLIHVNAFNVQDLIEPAEGGTSTEILQQTLDAVQQQSDGHNVPILATINHPNIRQSLSADDFKELEGARFFEVYSGHPNATNQGNSVVPSTEELWDEVLTYYVENGKDLLYGVATDDSHGYLHDDVNPTQNLPGRGWVQVNAEELSTTSLIEAMYEGKFYASTGVELTNVSFEDGTLSVAVDAEEGVNYTIQFIGTRSGESNNPGVVLAEEEGTEASYTLEGDELYVRAKITSDVPKPNASSTGEVEVAYVQPVTP